MGRKTRDDIGLAYGAHLVRGGNGPMRSTLRPGESRSLLADGPRRPTWQLTPGGTRIDPLAREDLRVPPSEAHAAQAAEYEAQVAADATDAAALRRKLEARSMPVFGGCAGGDAPIGNDR